MGKRFTSGSTKKTRVWIKTDKDTHFTSTILQNAIDVETLSDVLPNDEVHIHALVMISDEQINYDVYFFSSATANQNTDIDTDDTTGIAYMDLVSCGKQISSTGAYRMENRLDVPIHISNDTPNDTDLYIGLVPRSGGKTAGATGEVVIKLLIEPVYGGN